MFRSGGLGHFGVLWSVAMGAETYVISHTPNKKEDALKMGAKDFIVTKEHRRFKEFANAVRKEHTIGICHGDAGIGKTLSARRYAHWDTLGAYIDEWGPRTEDDAKHHATAN